MIVASPRHRDTEGQHDHDDQRQCLHSGASAEAGCLEDFVERQGADDDVDCFPADGGEPAERRCGCVASSAEYAAGHHQSGGTGTWSWNRADTDEHGDEVADDGYGHCWPESETKTDDQGADDDVGEDHVGAKP